MRVLLARRSIVSFTSSRGTFSFSVSKTCVDQFCSSQIASNWFVVCALVSGRLRTSQWRYVAFITILILLLLTFTSGRGTNYRRSSALTASLDVFRTLRRAPRIHFVMPQVSARVFACLEVRSIFDLHSVALADVHAALPSYRTSFSMCYVVVVVRHFKSTRYAQAWDSCGELELQDAC